jgi:hypothetical protein
MHPEIIELKPKQRSLEISEKQSNTSCNNNRVGRYYFYEIMLHFFNKYTNSENLGIIIINLPDPEVSRTFMYMLEG